MEDQKLSTIDFVPHEPTFGLVEAPNTSEETSLPCPKRIEGDRHFLHTHTQEELQKKFKLSGGGGTLHKGYNARFGPRGPC